MSYQTILLNSDHRKTDFDCGKEMLNSYLQRQANQDMQRHLSVCFVIVGKDNLVRCYDTSATIGSLAVVVDPIDQESKNFYLKYGFILLPDSHKMFLPMKTIGYLFEK